MNSDVYTTLVESGNTVKDDQPSFKYSGALETHYDLEYPENCLVQTR